MQHLEECVFINDVLLTRAKIINKSNLARCLFVPLNRRLDLILNYIANKQCEICVLSPCSFYYVLYNSVLFIKGTHIRENSITVLSPVLVETGFIVGGGGCY